MLDKSKSEELYFPYGVVRDEQDKMMLKVDECIREKKSLIVHAPTGIGKTISTLGPAIKHAIEKDLTILFLTSRHTQHLIAFETVKKIREKFDLKVHIADIVGKKAMCLQPGSNLMYSSDFFEFCKQLRESRKCEFYVNARKSSNSTTPKAEHIVSVIQSMNDADFEKVYKICEEESLCPYEISIELAKKARILICDYNYAFDPVVRNSLMSKIDKDIDRCILIIDEGHNLPERTRNIMTFKLSSVILKRAIREAKKFNKGDALNFLVQINEVLLSFAEGLKQDSEGLITKDDFFKKVNEIKDYETLVDDLEEAADEIREKQRNSYIGSIAFFLKMWNGEDAGFVRYITKSYSKIEPIITLSYRCLDPSLLTKSVLEKAYCSIMMSGTLTPVDMYKDLLGFPADTELMTLLSPFPVKNKLSLVVPKTTTQFKKRDESQFKEIASIASSIVNSIPGCCAVFFPSYEMMRSIYIHMDPLLEKTVFKESVDMNKKERKEMLEKLEEYRRSGAVLLGVASGSFGEGIDLPDNLLKGVVVVGLPLQRPDLETKELIAYYDRKYGKGWDYGYINPAFSKCLQNAGRCIRSETDRGIVVFLDERFTWPNYFKRFPPEMPISISMDYIKKINEFFGK